MGIRSAFASVRGEGFFAVRSSPAEGVSVAHGRQPKFRRFEDAAALGRVERGLSGNPMPRWPCGALAAPASFHLPLFVRSQLRIDANLKGDTALTRTVAPDAVRKSEALFQMCRLGKLCGATR